MSPRAAEMAAALAVLLTAAALAGAAPQESYAGAAETPAAAVAATRGQQAWGQASTAAWGQASSTAAPPSTTTEGLHFDTEWEPSEEWHRKGHLQLQRTLNRIQQREDMARRSSSATKPGVARNVVLFVGDGMGVATSTATGIMIGGEGHLLAWERFPSIGLTKTYSVDHQVPDSASTATAMLTGSKTHSRMLGLDARANKTDCDRDVNREAALTSMALWAQQAGKATGIVTTARVTHATPAAAYARINHRDWECDSKMPEAARGCVRDIARQLVEEAPGNELRVVLGGGRRQLGATGNEDAEADIDEDSCVRTDGRNLTLQWTALNGKREYVTTRAQLLDPQLPQRADYLMGLFAAGHLSYEAEREQMGGDQPSLKDMTRVAIRMLRRHGRANGFFLLVEGGRVDMAHHKNYARLALLDAAQLDEAVHAALDEVDLEDTLIVVTGDHSHAMTINGYPERGSDILGISYPEEKRDDPNAIKYETLTYSTGPGAKYHEGRRIEDIPEEERQQLRYRHQTGLFTNEDETHAGEDVPVYATGAGSELFVGVYEQSYIGTAMAYAAGVGHFFGQGPRAEPVGTGAGGIPGAATGAATTFVTSLLSLLLPLTTLGTARLLS